jgi:integrase
MRKSNQLNPAKIRSFSEPGRYHDGRGLYLQISNISGEKGQTTRSWVLRYMLNGVARHLGLGSCNDFTLAEARERARKARQQVAAGIDPVAEREAQRTAARIEVSGQMSFRECAERYIEAHGTGWRNDKHREQWVSSLSNYAYPVIGDLPVSGVALGHIVKILEPIWAKKTTTADRVRGRIERVLSWATVRGFRSGDNPARWGGHLEELFPAKKKGKKHLKALPYTDLPAMMEKLRAIESIPARALEFTVLTAARSGEIIGAHWSEIDLRNKTWTVPAERMKGHREHRVPLSDRAVAILQDDLPRIDGDDSVFVGLGRDAMGRLLASVVSDGSTVHGFRSTFKDWARSRTSFADEISEMALAHSDGNATRAAYARSDLFEKRRKLMGAWSSYCASRPIETGGVVAIRRA